MTDRAALPALLALCLLSACAATTLPAKGPAATAPDTAPDSGTAQRTAIGTVEGYQLMRVEGETAMGCSASRRVAEGDFAYVSLMRQQSGRETMALGGSQSWLELGPRRTVPAAVQIAGKAEPAVGIMSARAFLAYVGSEQAAALRRGQSAVLRFQGGFAVTRAFPPGVLDALNRCFAQTLAAAGLAPAEGGRVAVSRPPAGQPAAVEQDILSPDVASVRLE